jgi:hypothetical protein
MWRATPHARYCTGYMGSVFGGTEAVGKGGRLTSVTLPMRLPARCYTLQDCAAMVVAVAGALQPSDTGVCSRGLDFTLRVLRSQDVSRPLHACSAALAAWRL